MASTQIPEFHRAVVSVAKRAPLELLSVPTVSPTANEVLVRISHVANTPLNLHRADGGLLANYPQILSGAWVGSVVAIGPDIRLGLKVGDRVFGFSWRSPQEMPWQEFVTVPEILVGKVPEGVDDVKALATVPDSFVTAWHTLRAVLGMELPWPKPDGWKSRDADAPVLVWGGSGSVGFYVLQLLKWAGYTNVVTTAGAKHHDFLQKLGATQAFDYREQSIADKLNTAAGPTGFKYVVDCIGSLPGSVKPIANIVKEGASVAIMLPVIVRDATDDIEPIYSLEVQGEDLGVEWKRNVRAMGVRTHFYLEDKFNAENVQPVIMPSLLQSGDISPTSFRLVEGKDMLDRASKALDLLRQKAVSGERLILQLD